MHLPLSDHLIRAIATLFDFADLDLMDMPHIALRFRAASHTFRRGGGGTAGKRVVSELRG